MHRRQQRIWHLYGIYVSAVSCNVNNGAIAVQTSGDSVAFERKGNSRIGEQEEPRKRDNICRRTSGRQRTGRGAKPLPAMLRAVLYLASLLRSCLYHLPQPGVSVYPWTFPAMPAAVPVCLLGRRSVSVGCVTWPSHHCLQTCLLSAHSCGGMPEAVSLCLLSCLPSCWSLCSCCLWRSVVGR